MKWWKDIQFLHKYIWQRKIIWGSVDSTGRTEDDKKKQPKYPPLLVVLGQSLIASDSADAALLAGSEAKELDPSNANAYEVIEMHIAAESCANGY